MTSENRTKWIHLRVSPTELKKINDRFKKTTSQLRSDFIRRVLTEDKITAFTRSKSLDELIPELVQLRKEMNAIGKNLNQVTRRLQTDLARPELRVWLEENQKGHLALHVKMKEIITRMDYYTQRWLQE